MKTICNLRLIWTFKTQIYTLKIKTKRPGLPYFIRQDPIVDVGKICSDCCMYFFASNFISLVSLHQYVSSCMCILFKFDSIHFISQICSYQYSFSIYIWIHITFQFIWLFIFFFRHSHRSKFKFVVSEIENWVDKARSFIS